MKTLREAFRNDAYHRLDYDTKLQGWLKPLKIKARLRARLFQALYINVGRGILEEFD